MEIKRYKDAIALAKSFADFLVNLIEEKNGPIFIGLSGGSTPKILFSLLAEEEYRKKIDWAKVHLFWGDERCVPPDHSDSNYKMTYEQLLSKIIIPAQNVHRVLGENNPEVEAERYAKEIESILPHKNHLPIFDLVMLGMGDDGHTLSIFPHQMPLLYEESLCAVAKHPTSGQKRVTLTGKVANAAKISAFLVTGKTKAKKLHEIIKKEGDWKSYPASYIQPTDGFLYWFVDEEAGELI